MIDWTEIVADSVQNPPKNDAKAPCPDSAGRNKPQNPEKVGTAETLSIAGFQGFVPTVPTCFERPRVEEQEKCNALSFKKPDGGGVEGPSAPHKKARESSCLTCAHLCRPGLSNGHCAGRDDLPFAYTAGHPLRQLPPDGGAICPTWALHPSMIWQG